MISLSRLVESAGQTFLHPVQLETEVEVHDLALAELRGDADVQPGDLVLGVALVTLEEALGVLARSAESGAAGLVLRPPLARDPELLTQASRSRVGVVELQDGVTWTDLLWLLRMLIDRSGSGGTIQLRGNVHEELFRLADAAAAILDAPVTIEDVNSRVIAHSEQQAHTDPARVATIVGRRVPREVVEHFRSLGVFRKLATSHEPIFVPAGDDGIQPRFILPVHAGSELLGSIWAIVTRSVPAEQVVRLQETAGTLALHLLQLRAQDDATRWVASDRLRALLRAPHTSGYVDLPPGPWRVVGVSTYPGATDAMHHLLLWESVVRRHGWRQPLLTEIDGSLFAVLSDGGDSAGSLGWWSTMINTIVPDTPGLRASIGSRADTRIQLRQSYLQAAELLDLQLRSPATQLPVRLESAWAALATDRLVSAHPDPSEVLIGPLATLLDHDREHATPYVETLAAFVAQQGSIPRAAGDLHIHTNTLRYRLQRLRAVVTIDLDDKDVRQSLSLQLTVLQWLRSGQRDQPEHSADDTGTQAKPTRP